MFSLLMVAGDIRALKEGLAQGCATAHITVVNEMRRQGLTCVSIIPTHDVIRAAVSNAIQYHRAKSNAKAQIAVIYININFPPEHSLLLSDEYSFMLQKMGITKEIYKYADRISASVAEESLYNFILFTTRGAVELETDRFQKFELLRWIQDVTEYTISIGVGNGETAVEARHNAFCAMLKAKVHPENTAYVMLADGAPLGPYTCGKRGIPLPRTRRKWSSRWPARPESAPIPSAASTTGAGKSARSPLPPGSCPTE